MKRRNDNHSPGPVIRELVPSSHQRSELNNIILCIFSGTPRYLMLSMFSRSFPSKVYEAWIFFSCHLHHIIFDRLKSHTPLPCPGTQSINIPLKFHCVFFILNFTIANTVISKKSYFRLNIMSFMYKENNKGTRTVPWGTPDKTGAQSDFTPFTTTRCCLKQRK